MILLIFLWVAILISIWWLFNKSASRYAEYPPMPPGFLKLDKIRRTKALSLYWKFGYKELAAVPIRSGANLLFSIFSLLIFMFFALLVLVTILVQSKKGDINLIWETGEMGTVFVFMMLLGTLFFAAFQRGLKERRESLALEESDKKENTILHAMAAEFIQDNYNLWVDKMLDIVKQDAITLLNLVKTKTFVLTSSKLAINYTTRSVPVPPKLLVTFIFSNGFVSTASGIILDVRKTSEGYKDSDELNLCYTHKDEIETDEFHFKDIVEISYEPAAATNKTEYADNEEIPIEGFLKLGLVNGSRKKYPSTKNSVAEFINLSREKVRENKKS